MQEDSAAADLHTTYTHILGKENKAGGAKRTQLKREIFFQQVPPKIRLFENKTEPGKGNPDLVIA